MIQQCPVNIILHGIRGLHSPNLVLQFTVVFNYYTD